MNIVLAGSNAYEALLENDCFHGDLFPWGRSLIHSKAIGLRPHLIMTGAGALSIREAARRVERDVKAVHGDVTALLNAGLLSKTDDGMIVFPYDAIHVDFMLKAA